MNMRSAALASAIAVGLLCGGCNSGAGGSPGAGGSGGGGGAACPSVTACGGSVVGTWTVSSSCLRVTGALDLAVAGASCPSAPITGSLAVTGTLTANADGTYSDDTTTSGDHQFTLAPSCLVISSTPVTCDGAASIIKTLGYASLTCTPAAGGGCACAGTVHHTGSLGLISVAPSTSGSYTTSGNAIALSGDAGDARYSYCVAGDKLTVTPQSTSPTITGTIVLQKGGAAGTGGTTGAAGSGGAAGSAGAGGSTGAAGTAGGSGTTGAGGTTGGGGRGGAGGGATGAGGRGGAGGTTATGGRGGAAGAGGMAGTGSAGAGGTGSVVGPCDIYKNAGNPCVAAHSTVRALVGAYSGKLYQVRNAAGATKDILTLTPGGVADGLSQDSFCSGTTCVTTVLYDQSGHGNDLWYQGSTMVPASTSSRPATATTESLTLNGHKVYSLYINPNNSYWVDASKSGIATGSQPEGLYMVTSGKHFNSGCCFDYGNSETDRNADGPGTMDAINLSSITAWGTGAGNGPWVMADLEYGIFSQTAGGSKNQNDPSQTSTYVTAVLKNNGTTEFALRGCGPGPSRGQLRSPTSTDSATRGSRRQQPSPGAWSATPTPAPVSP